MQIALFDKTHVFLFWLGRGRVHGAVGSARRVFGVHGSLGFLGFGVSVGEALGGSGVREVL